ncbi:MAG: diacylglycerol kinase family protein [Bacillota bacterium]
MACRSFFKAFVYAFRGIRWVSLTQRNMRIHIGLAVVVLAAAAWLRLSLLETSVIILAIALVTVAEIINSAVEKAVDLVTLEKHPVAGLAKDAAAGAVLLAAFFSVVIGLLIFVPHILELIKQH